MSEPDPVTPEDERRGEQAQDCDDPYNEQIDREQARYEDWMLGDK